MTSLAMAVPMTWTDEELVDRSKTGDTESFNQLVRRWERPIFALAYRTLGREEDAQHFAQLAARDKAVDAELSELAKGTLNPEASADPLGGATEQSARTH